MIDDVRELIRSNWSVFQDGDQCDTAALSFTKFCQRIAGPHTKVLYFVTYRGKPLCILKTVRSGEYNDNLKREASAQRAAMALGRVRAPQVLFEGKVGERYLYAEEYVDGLPVSRAEYAERKDALDAFVRALPQGGTIATRELAALLKRHAPAGLFERELGLLSESNEVLQLGLTHGDLGRPNILSSRGTLYVIDWERAGDIPLAGIDSVTLGTEGAPTLVAISTVYTVLYKKYPERYRSLVTEFHFV